VIGKEPPGYTYISRFFDAALDKIGQILKDSKMASISTQNTLANRTTVPGGHFRPISSPFCCLGGDMVEFMA
jgi:hypothetical protein